MSNESKPTNQNTKMVAGAAGAGGGTLLVLLANNLPEASAWKPWLIIIAPSASVFLGGIFFWVKEKVAEFFHRKDLYRAISEARITLEEALNNEATTDDHKEKLRSELEKLEKLSIAARMQEVEALVE